MKFKSITVFLIATGLYGNVGAEVILDGSLGTTGEIAPVEGNYDIGADVGQQSGANLFHSFDTFNVDTGQSATFSGPNSVSNIVSRVTGDSASTINGRIISTIPEANLWLINPKGIVFGQGSSLDIQGSFHASTGDYVQLRDGTEFNADISELTLLTSSAPQAFGFITDETSSGATLKVENTQLSVAEGEQISLVGRDVQLKASVLSAPGGQVSAVSISDAGEVFYSDQGFEAYSLDENGEPDQIQAFSGPLSISSTAFKVDGDQQGNLQVQGGDIEINTHNTDFVSTVSNIKASFFEDVDLLEEPCELAEFYGQGSLSFTVDAKDEETRFGVEVKKARSGALGALPAPECL